jgi:hypothetical protein
MSTLSEPSRDADEAVEVLRGLANATRAMDNPTEVYTLLGSVSLCLASLEQVLHQLGQLHDGQAREHARIAGDPRAGRAASYEMAWELHRAAEMVHQVAAGLDRAHEVEATIGYELSACPTPVNGHGVAIDLGLSL